MVTPLNPYTASNTALLSPPFTKKEQNFSEEISQRNIQSHLVREKLLSKKVVTVVTVAETIVPTMIDAVTTFVTTPCHHQKLNLTQLKMNT